MPARDQSNRHKRIDSTGPRSVRRDIPFGHGNGFDEVAPVSTASSGIRVAPLLAFLMRGIWRCILVGKSRQTANKKGPTDGVEASASVALLQPYAPC
jgi:hypothetical protein